MSCFDRNMVSLAGCFLIKQSHFDLMLFFVLCVKCGKETERTGSGAQMFDLEESFYHSAPEKSMAMRQQRVAFSSLKSHFHHI